MAKNIQNVDEKFFNEKVLVAAVEPKLDYETKVQKVDANGVPLWSVTNVRPAGGEIFKLTVAAETDPTDEILHKVVAFFGLSVGAYAEKRGQYVNAHLYFRAQGWIAA